MRLACCRLHECLAVLAVQPLPVDCLICAWAKPCLTCGRPQLEAPIHSRLSSHPLQGMFHLLKMPPCLGFTGLQDCSGRFPRGEGGGGGGEGDRRLAVRSLRRGQDRAVPQARLDRVVCPTWSAVHLPNHALISSTVTGACQIKHAIMKAGQLLPCWACELLQGC